MKLRAASIVLIGALGATGCTATPIPQPPPENLDVGKIAFPEVSPATDVVEFSGSPGAAPPNSMLRITNLETMDPPWLVQVADDGSFEASIIAGEGDELRFQVRDGADRKVPIDLVLSAAGFQPPERIDCFTVEPELVFASTATSVTGTLGFANDCTEGAQVTVLAFRTADASFTLNEPLMPIPEGGASGTMLTFMPTTPGEHEEVLLVSVNVGGVTARYPATLFGIGQ